MSKTCLSVGVGGIRQLVFSNIVIKDFSFDLGHSIFDDIDQNIAGSAGTIKIGQMNLKQSVDYREKHGLEAHHAYIDNIDYTSAKKIFPQVKYEKFKGIFKAAYNGDTLPNIINEEFGNPKMEDFSSRTALAVYGNLPNGEQGTRLITSYDHPKCPVAPVISASSAFPLILPGITIKSEWLGEEAGKEHILFDSGIGCPNPMLYGYDEVEKIANDDEKIICFSILMHDKKYFDLLKLQKGGFYHWITPSKNSPLVRAPFDELIALPHREMIKNARRSRGQLEYHSIHANIDDEMRFKYGVNFDSADSSDDNLGAFEEVTHQYMQLDSFKENKEGILRSLQIRHGEKSNHEYNKTMIELNKADTTVIQMAVQDNSKPIGTNGSQHLVARA